MADKGIGLGNARNAREPARYSPGSFHYFRKWTFIDSEKLEL